MKDVRPPLPLPSRGTVTLPNMYLAEYQLGDMIVLYPHDAKTDQVGLWLIPSDRLADTVERRAYLTEMEALKLNSTRSPAWRVDSLVHLHIRGHQFAGGFGIGQSLRQGESTKSLRFENQHVEESDQGKTIITRLKSDEGYVCEHHLSHGHGDRYLRIHTVFHNTSDHALTLELLTSLSLGGLTPFAHDDAPHRMHIHRFRSHWTAEARWVTDSLEHFHLERSWSGHVNCIERFGQVGSFPTNGFFPTVAIEDAIAGVFWGAQLACPGSWQIELVRNDDCLNCSGGLADRNFGHWYKTINPGESFRSPQAVLSVVTGDIDLICDRLTSSQIPAVETQPAIEHDLPICFDDWLSSGGRPTHDNIIEMADRLKDSGVTYFEIDAGWYLPEEKGIEWSHAQGDWIPSKTLFPQGMAAVVQAIRDRGLIPGIWFEMEVAGPGSKAFTEQTDHFLKRDGQCLTVANRRFWDYRDPTALKYLSNKVIDFLEQNGFGYAKIDYNETIGIGCDGAESPGEGLRQHLEAVQNFIRQMRKRLPGLVIENCAAGGHRLEPSFQALAAIGCSSDSLEGYNLPLICANLHRLILPRQSIVWVVVREADTPRRLTYSLASSFLGRMCLSGKIHELSAKQWDAVKQAIQLYKKVTPIIKDGFSRIFGPYVKSFRYPEGWQAVMRTTRDNKQALLVLHSFANPNAHPVTFDLPSAKSWRIVNTLSANPVGPVIKDGQLRCSIDGEYDAAVIWLVSE